MADVRQSKEGKMFQKPHDEVDNTTRPLDGRTRMMFFRYSQISDRPVFCLQLHIQLPLRDVYFHLKMMSSKWRTQRRKTQDTTHTRENTRPASTHDTTYETYYRLLQIITLPLARNDPTYFRRLTWQNSHRDLFIVGIFIKQFISGCDEITHPLPQCCPLPLATCDYHCVDPE